MLLPLLALFVILFILFPLLGMALWAFMSTVVVGLFMGALARMILPGRQAIGFIATVLSGLSGSILGGFLGQHVWHLSRPLTVLIEIAVATAIVAAVSAMRREPTRPVV